MKKVVVIGGGTGIFPVTTALKHLDVLISTIIAVSDSGGSTGRIRDEFGFQPTGDLRQSLAALAEDTGQEWIRKLLLYRFTKGNGLKGHNLGNLILTALQDMTGSTTEALYQAQRIFRLDGAVIPATTQNVDLKIDFTDGTSIVGEHFLDGELPKGKKIKKVSLTPSARINSYAIKFITEADMIIIGPGDYYASIMAALAPHGIKAAFKKTKANIVYLVNLMTRATQTKDMTAKDHVQGIEKAIGRDVTTIVINSQQPSATLLRMYENFGEYPVIDDLQEDKRVVRADIISDIVFTKEKEDSAHRSLLRHDNKKLLSLLKKIIR